MSPSDADTLFAKIIALGFKGVNSPWNAFWGQRYAPVQDPDGNQVDIFADI